MPYSRNMKNQATPQHQEKRNGQNGQDILDKNGPPRSTENIKRKPTNEIRQWAHFLLAIDICCSM